MRNVSLYLKQLTCQDNSPLIQNGLEKPSPKLFLLLESTEKHHPLARWEAVAAQSDSQPQAGSDHFILSRSGPWCWIWMEEDVKYRDP